MILCIGTGLDTKHNITHECKMIYLPIHAWWNMFLKGHSRVQDDLSSHPCMVEHVSQKSLTSARWFIFPSMHGGTCFSKVTHECKMIYLPIHAWWNMFLKGHSRVQDDLSSHPCMVEHVSQRSLTSARWFIFPSMHGGTCFSKVTHECKMTYLPIRAWWTMFLKGHSRVQDDLSSHPCMVDHVSQRSLTSARWFIFPSMHGGPCFSKVTHECKMIYLPIHAWWNMFLKGHSRVQDDLSSHPCMVEHVSQRSLTSARWFIFPSMHGGTCFSKVTHECKMIYLPIHAWWNMFLKGHSRVQDDLSSHPCMVEHVSQRSLTSARWFIFPSMHGGPCFSKVTHECKMIYLPINAWWNMFLKGHSRVQDDLCSHPCMLEHVSQKLLIFPSTSSTMIMCVLWSSIETVARSRMLYRWTWISQTQWDQENWSVISKIRRIHMTNTWYASDWDQAYCPSYAKIRRTVVRHIQVHLYCHCAHVAVLGVLKRQQKKMCLKRLNFNAYLSTFQNTLINHFWYQLFWYMTWY